MLRNHIAFLLFAVLAACGANETVRNYGGGDKVWQLISVNESAFNATATLTFPDSGGIAGKAPCNSYFATMTVPYPWFKIGPITATEMACPALAQESKFFELLGKMQQAEVLGDTMVLTDGAGIQLVFKAGD